MRSTYLMVFCVLAAGAMAQACNEGQSRTTIDAGTDGRRDTRTAGDVGTKGDAGTGRDAGTKGDAATGKDVGTKGDAATGKDVGTKGDAATGKPKCSDGIDNDGDGKIDYPDDLECNTPNDTTENVDGDGWPTAATTGWQHTGVTLTPYTGPTTISTPGTLIDGKDVSSCLTINAANVTIKRSRVRCDNGNWVIHHTGGANLLIEDTEVASTTPPIDPTWCPTCTTRAIEQSTPASMTIRRVYAHNTEAGIAFDGGNTTVEYSYVGNNANRAQNPGASDQHTTAAKSNGGTKNAQVRFNTLRCETGANCSAAISIYEDFGVNDGIVVEGNILAASAGYCMYGWQPVSSNLRIVNNRFSTEFYVDCGAYGYAVNNAKPPGGASEWTNNRWYDLRPTAGGYTNKNGNLVPQ